MTLLWHHDVCSKTKEGRVTTVQSGSLLPVEGWLTKVVKRQPNPWWREASTNERCCVLISLPNKSLGFLNVGLKKPDPYYLLFPCFHTACNMMSHPSVLSMEWVRTTKTQNYTTTNMHTDLVPHLSSPELIY